MRSTSAAAAAIAALAVLGGCTSTDPTVAGPSSAATDAPTAAASPTTAAPATPTVAAPGTPSTPGTAARVVLVRTGGIAGTRETVTVEPGGRWTRVDRAGGTRSGRLGTTDLARLRQLTADPRLATETTATADPGDCADAFVYRLTVNTRTTGYVDCDAGPDRPPATSAVVELLTRATA